MVEAGGVAGLRLPGGRGLALGDASSKALPSPSGTRRRVPQLDEYKGSESATGRLRVSGSLQGMSVRRPATRGVCGVDRGRHGLCEGARPPKSPSSPGTSIWAAIFCWAIDWPLSFGLGREMAMLPRVVVALRRARWIHISSATPELI